MEDIQSKIRNSLMKYVASDDKLLLAVSGGADSIAMLYLLHISNYYSGKLHVGYVNHRIRKESNQDSSFIQNVCQNLHIPFCVRKVNVPQYSKDHGLSLEHAARVLRYKELAEMAIEHKCQWILTAHTLDDSAETVMMRLLNDSPWYECTAIPERREQILRPLLALNRDELRSWVKQNDIEYREDATNLDIKFQRNKLRAVLSSNPIFWNNSTKFTLNLNGQIVLAEINNLKRTARLILGHDFYQSKSCIGLAIEDIFHYFSKLSFIPVEMAWSELSGQTDGRLGSKYRRQIMDCLKGKSPTARIILPNNILLLRRGSRLWLMRDETLKLSHKLPIGKSAFEKFQCHLYLKNTNQDDEINDGIEAELNSQFAERDLFLRNWMPGDRIKAAGSRTKKVSDYFCEKKMNPYERANALVIADSEGPLMIVGGPIAERALPIPNDNDVLKINIQYGS